MAARLIYTKELAQKICDRLACGIQSLSALVKDMQKEDPSMPSYGSIMRWRLDEKLGFEQMYIQAKRMQIEPLVDDILRISDDISEDNIELENGDIVCNKLHIARAKLMIDTRKWLAEKLTPSLYGTKILNQVVQMRQEEAILELKKLDDISQGVLPPDADAGL